MRIGRYVAAALLTLFLAASVSYRWWAERPYRVTGVESDYPGGAFEWSVNYTIPGGGIGTWRLRTRSISLSLVQCLRDVRVGQRIPPCTRTLVGVPDFD